MSELINRVTSVYIVEDQEILRTGIRLALSRSANFEIVGLAGDGLTALHQIKELQPDVVLMDISLPQMTGIETTIQIKKECPGVKVIILSAHEDDENVFASFSAGASGYCLKDLPGHKLQLAIHSVMSGATWVDEKVAIKLLRCVNEQIKRISQDKLNSTENIKLSDRELEVCRHVAEGLRNKEIARNLQISISTVRSHISKMGEKLSANSRTQIVLRAKNGGLI